jgi:LysR family transcriptional regulator, glycine cleavage system transcriptional activator
MISHISLSALRSFEATARHRSMTRAAVELGVTQGAISRAVAALQEDLRAPLFFRTRPLLTLTEEGEQLYAEVRFAFERIRAVATRIRQKRNGSELRINALPTFGLRFLIPRLPRFQRRHPDILVDILVGEQTINFAVDAIDVALRYGDGAWPHSKAYRLMDEELVLVCAPQHLMSFGEEIAPDLLQPKHLIRHTTRLEAWSEWFSLCGVEPAPVPTGPGFEHFFLVIEAALAGMGFALLPRFLISAELQAGTLTVASRFVLRRRQGYFLLCAPERHADPSILSFHRWLQSEIQLDRAGPIDETR